ncbi:MAG: ABC transporter permease [Microthrixaceae bacterium]|nr:ABC transporter permease [Acidimicrobiales bacterium]MCB9404215.1 ABC transporter permease [Microthrixaceae bacterium]
MTTDLTHPMTIGTTTAPTEHEEAHMTTTEAPFPLAVEVTNTSGPRSTAQLAAVLRSERIKATTVRANQVLVTSSAIIGLLISWATAAFVTDEALTATDVFVYPTLLTAVLAAIAGVLLFTTEVQHGTLPAALTAHPSRWPVVAAKSIVATGFGLVLGAVGLAAGFVGALAGGIEVGDTSGMATTVFWALLYTAGSALLGLSVGMVVRHSAGTVSGLLVWWLVVEGMVVSFAPVQVVRFVPFDAGARTLGIETDMDRPEVVAAGLANALHASIFWGYVIASLVLGAVVLVRLDAD